MIRVTSRWLVASIALLASGCTGPQYLRQAPAAPGATLEVALANYDSSLDVWIFLDTRCDQQPGAGRLVQMPAGRPITYAYTIDAGRELFVRSHGKGDPQMERFSLLTMLAFTPVAGRTYRLEYAALGNGPSRFSVVDTTLGRPPEGARLIDPPESCMMKMKRWEQ